MGYGNTTLTSSPISVGVPITPTISALCKNMGSYFELIFSVPSNPYVTNYLWEIGNTPQSQGTGLYIIPPVCGGDPSLISMDYYIGIAETNQCGAVSACKIFRYTCNPFPAINSIGSCNDVIPIELAIQPSELFTISPNPASENITVSLKGERVQVGNAVYESTSSSLAANPSKRYTLRLFNSNGAPVRTTSLTGSSVTFPTSNLLDGLYFVELNDGVKSYKQQLIIKH